MIIFNNIGQGRKERRTEVNTFVDFTFRSMDVMTLLPNCKTNSVIKKIKEDVTRCCLKYENINEQSLVKLVSVLTKGKSSI